MSINPKVALLLVAVIASVGSAVAAQSVADNPGMRYATDAYPGFDGDYDDWAPEKKEPRFFSFRYGVSEDTPAEQLEFARRCEREGSDSKARRAYDALVREWPTSPEAPVAQQALAELIMVRFSECDNAFAEFRYLLDFYPSKCDYHAVCLRMYEIVRQMREEGRSLMLFRFSNVTAVRHAYEALIVRSPGEAFVPEAMLEVARMREEELHYEQAVQVFENLRNHYPETPEAVKSFYLESRIRMELLRDHEYNRNRSLDTISFLGYAEKAGLSPEDLAEVKQWRVEARRSIEEEAFAAAEFYDSRTRTKRSAISAYERFLSEYPDSAYADEARERIAELKGE